MRFRASAVLVGLLVAARASADEPAIQITSLKVMLEKKLITQDEYDSALRDVAVSSGARAAGDTNTLVVSKFAATLYGFAELDAIHDSTQSFTELQGNTQVARNESFGGQHDRFQASIRNSRIGIRVKVPEFHQMRLSGQLEMDFLGNQPTVGYGQPYFISEAAFYSNPAFRARHVNLKLETPVLDFLFGQYWALFGWQPYFHPNTVDIQGVPVELYSRRPQARVSKTIKTDPVNVDLAIAALDPVQRDSGAPEPQAGLRIAFNKWRGKTTNGSTGTQIAPASLGVSTDIKYVRLPEFSAAPKKTVDGWGSSIAINAFLPVIPVPNENTGNALSITGEFVTGYGVADQYSGMSGGVSFPALPNPLNIGTNPPPSYTQTIDNGIVSFDGNGQLHFVQWTTGIVGLQYYFPGTRGKLWVALNYGHAESSNSKSFGSAAKIRQSLDWLDANLFIDPIPGFRLGIGYGRTYDNYVDKQQAINDRVQGSAFLIF